MVNDSPTRQLPRGPLPRPASRRAFALLEVLTAGVILGVALAVLMGLTASAMSSQRKGEDLAIAAMLADEQLNGVLVIGPDNYARTQTTKGPCAAPYERFAFDLSLSGGSTGQPYAVAVRITWSAAGREQSILVETLVAPRLGEDPDPERIPMEPPQRLQ